MEKTVNQNTNTAVAEFDVEVLRKRLYELKPEEIRNNFKKVKCVIRRQKFGKGDNTVFNYNAVLKFHEMFDVKFKLTQAEYLNICLARNPDSDVIPESLSINAYYVPVKATRQDGSGEYHQIKAVLSVNVRKKTFLRPLEVMNAKFLELFEFYDRPEFVEDDLDQRTEEEL